MSSVQHLREFIRERLTAAAEEIFTEVEKTIVRYEEDIRLLETCWKPQIKLTRIDQPKQRVGNRKEVLTHPQLWNQQRSSGLDQQEPEPPEIRRNQQEPEPPEIRRNQQEPEPRRIRGKQQEPDHQLIKDQEEPAFGKTVVRYQEETRPLGICWNPHIQLTRTGLPKQHVCREEEVLSGQQLWNQEEPEPQLAEDELSDAEYLQFEEDRENQEGPVMNEGQEDLRLNQKEPEPPPQETGHKEIQLQTVKICSSQPLLPDCDTFMKPLSDEECELEPEPELLRYQNPPEAQNSLDCIADPRQIREEPGHLQQQQEELSYSHRKRQKKQKCHKKIQKRERVNFCGTCGKRYYYLKSLLTHMRTHAPKLHLCETCGNKFSSEEACNSHMLEHSLDKLHQCETCGERFYRKAALLKHVRDHFDHTSYPCEICGKRCFSGKALLVHMKTHTGEESYSCESCGNRFISYSGLQLHMRVHTAEKLYSCDVCGKTFTLACQLNRHLKSNSCGGESPTKQQFRLQSTPEYKHLI
ncbi:uncharacterized protein FYW61_011500 [Anableps anableps]